MRPEITQQITFLYTNDLTASADFYGRILGLPLWLDQGTCRIYQVCDTAQVVEKQGNIIFTLVTPQGIEFEKSPAVNEKYRIYNFMFRDPNGYLIEIQRFLD
jgi:catechol 2,3-dioxygenase-like lactoylglutathione lyase family enzyme